jgi:hypothetical protein
MPNTQTIIEEVSSGYIDAAMDWDAEGRGFLVVAHAPNPQNNNDTFADVYIAEDGDNYALVDTIDPDLKITNLKMTHRDVGTPKDQLFVYMTTRRGGTGQVLVDTRVEAWVLNDVWATSLAAPAEPPTPCVPPGDRPYFKPNRAVTRAQLSKIVSIALGLPAPVAGTQTFEDVQEGSTFHEYVEALYAIGAINGYPCTEEE